MSIWGLQKVRKYVYIYLAINHQITQMPSFFPQVRQYFSPEEANILTSTRNASPSHVLLDPTGSVGKMFDAKTTPHMYIIDEKGLMKYQGAIDDAGGRGFVFKDQIKEKNYN